MLRARLLLLAVLLVALCSGCDFFRNADQRVSRANEQIAAHDYGGAMIELKNALQSEPDHIPARLLLAEVSLWMGDSAAADKELRRALDAGAKPADTGDLAARIRLAQGQSSELLTMIDAGEIPLTEPAKSTYRGRALLASHEVDLAIAAFNVALKTDNGYRDARLGLTEAYSQKGQTQQALGVIEPLLAAPPADADAAALLARGGVLARQGRFQAAEADLTRARDRRAELNMRQQALLLATLAETQLARGATKDARASQKALAQIAPNAPATALISARIAMADQDYATAVAELQRLLTALPRAAGARIMLGAALFAQGNLNQAESQLARAVQDSPENLQARKLLAQVRLRLRQPEAALQALTPVEGPGDGDSDVDALMGLAHLQLGDASAAAKFLERGAQLRPDDPGSVGNLNLAAAYYAQRGDFERARSYLGKALALKPDDESTLLTAARLEFATGNLSAANARLEGIIAAHPQNTVARLALAELAVRTGDLPAAARSLEAVRKQDPKAIRPRLALARVYLLDKQTSQADALLREIEAIGAGRPEVLNAIGLLYLDAGRREEALSKFKATVAGDGSNANYWLNLARAQLALDRNALARESLEKARGVKPDSMAVVTALVMLDVREGKRDAALQRIAQLRKERPTDAAVSELEGDYYMQTQRYELAASAYDRAISQRPAGATALKASRARQLGHMTDTAAPLESWLSAHPDDLAMQVVLAEAYARGGKSAQAIEKYELAVSNGPANAVVLNNLAWLYYQARDPRAELTAARAYGLQSGNPAIADTYGWILVEKGKLAEGTEILKKAAASSGGNPDIEYHYAAALARAGQVEIARQTLTSLAAREGFASQAEAKRLLQELSK